MGAAMLDLASLFASSGNIHDLAETLEPCGNTPDCPPQKEEKVGHSGHNGKTANVPKCARPDALCHNGFDGFGTVGTLGTVDFQRGEGQMGNGAPGGGAARGQFALHPAAVILALACLRKMEANHDERVAALLQLETMPSDDQVMHWHACCVEVGIKPWEVLSLPASTSGQDCTMCKHLTTRQMAGESGRRQFHWACGLGYLILETGRGTERIWIAPPDCLNWERWRPGGGGSKV